MRAHAALFYRVVSCYQTVRSGERVHAISGLPCTVGLLSELACSLVDFLLHWLGVHFRRIVNVVSLWLHLLLVGVHGQAALELALASGAIAESSRALLLNRLLKLFVRLRLNGLCVLQFLD